MRTISIRELNKNISKVFKDLPVAVSKNGKIVATIMPACENVGTLKGKNVGTIRTKTENVATQESAPIVPLEMQEDIGPIIKTPTPLADALADFPDTLKMKIESRQVFKYGCGCPKDKSRLCKTHQRV